MWYLLAPAQPRDLQSTKLLVYILKKHSYISLLQYFEIHYKSQLVINTTKYFIIVLNSSFLL